MASYWKSQPRRFCDVCKCWTADNKASIEFHERGKSHQEKKQKQLLRIRKESLKQAATDAKADSLLKQMERGAMKSFMKDLNDKGINAQKALQGNRIMSESWTEKKTATGRTYYWNTVSEETSWSKPENYQKPTPAPAPKPAQQETYYSMPTPAPTQIETNYTPIASTTGGCSIGHPLGKWMTVEYIPKAEKVPEAIEPAPTHDEPSTKKIKFEERTVENLQSESENSVKNISFKKAKGTGSGKSRSIRKRTNPD